MQIQDIVKINASTTDGAKPVSGKDEALFAEFTKTLDKIVTKLQSQDRSAAFSTQSAEKVHSDQKQQQENISDKKISDRINQGDERNKKLDLIVASQVKLASKDADTSTNQNDKKTGKNQTEDSQDQASSNDTDEVVQS
jgi:hypothetical protein